MKNTHQSQHTPGPWTIKRIPECTVAIICDADGQEIASMQEDAAVLAVAAPEMYEALKACVRLIQSYENPQNIVTSVQLDALKAIAKAEGKE
jgi:hypothetical protein